MSVSETQLKNKLDQSHLDNRNRIRNLNREYQANIKNTKAHQEDATTQREVAHRDSKESIVKAYETRIKDNGERFQLAMQRANYTRNRDLQEQKEFYENQLAKQKQTFKSEFDNIQKDFANTTKINNIKLNNFVERQQETEKRNAVSQNNEKQKISEHYKNQIKKLHTEHQKELSHAKSQGKA